MKNTKILELAKKLYELSKRGEDGEKENATIKLGDVMKKYAITLDMLESEEQKERIFYAENGIERKFTMQIISSVVGNRDTYRYNEDAKKKKKRIIVFLSDIEFIEVSEKLTFYWDKYNEDLKIFYSAFIQKNKLYKKEDPKDKQEQPPLTKEQEAEVLKTLKMMQGIDHHTHQKMLENQ